MIANSATPYPGGVPHPFTLNDLRVHNTIAEEPSSTSALALSGLALAAVLAIGAFIWLDPLRLFTPTEASPPTPAFVPSVEPARPTERQEIVAPLTPAPATKSVEAPIAPAPVVQAPVVKTPVVQAPVVQAPVVQAPVVQAPVVQAPEVQAPVVQAPVVRPRAASIKPDSRGNPMDKTTTTVARASSNEKTAPPALLTKPEEKASPPAFLTKPEEKTDAPIVPKVGDDTRNAPKPAVTNDQAPAPE